MADKVALLRGVNVGGRKVVMAELRAVAEGLGWREVATYIASGNLVFSADGDLGALAAMLEAAIADRIGLVVEVCVLSAGEMAAVLARCPFPDAPGNHVHAFFCWQVPEVDRGVFADLRAPDEEMEVCGTTVWLHAPSGIGRSVVAAKIGTIIRGTTLTARNLNTVRALADRLA